jgi:hypothetical protein
MWLLTELPAILLESSYRKHDSKDIHDPGANSVNIESNFPVVVVVPVSSNQDKA